MVVNPEDAEWLVRVATEAQMSGSSPGPSTRRVPWEAMWRVAMLAALVVLAWGVWRVAQAVEGATASGSRVRTAEEATHDGR